MTPPTRPVSWLTTGPGPGLLQCDQCRLRKVCHPSRVFAWSVHDTSTDPLRQGNAVFQLQDSQEGLQQLRARPTPQGGTATGPDIVAVVRAPPIPSDISPGFLTLVQRAQDRPVRNPPGRHRVDAPRADPHHHQQPDPLGFGLGHRVQRKPQARQNSIANHDILPSLHRQHHGHTRGQHPQR